MSLIGVKQKVRVLVARMFSFRFKVGCVLNGACNRSVAQLVEHRSPKPGAGGSSPSAPARAQKEEIKMAESRQPAWVTFIKQVRFEAKKVIWPKRPEVLTTTLFVFVMVTLFSIFFIGVDGILSFGVRWLLQ